MPKPRPEKPEFARISLTIPMELKEELERVAAHQNWSLWAAECFRTRLLGIKAKQRMGSDMKTVIERLRESLELDKRSEFDEGTEAGRKWAENVATAGQLLRLAGLSASGAFGPRRSAGTRRGWPGALADAIHGARLSENEIMQFWKSCVGHTDVKLLFETDLSLGPTDFLRGFVDGAVKTWDAVRDKL